MSNTDLLHEILNLRGQCLAKMDEDNNDLSNLHEQLLKWQHQIINDLNKFIQDKFDEIKQKRLEINRRLIRHLDILYSNCLTTHIDNNSKQFYSQLFEDLNNIDSSIQIHNPKQIDFNQYLQINMDSLHDINRSILSINNTNHFHLSSYQFLSTVSIQSNITSLFATHDRLLVYYDHHTSSASLHIFDLQAYLDQTNNARSCLKFRVPCKQFQGKIMHMEYCSYLQKFLLATVSKLFTLYVSSTSTNHRMTEYFDIVHGNFPGILKTFTCHPVSTNFLYLLVNTFSQHTLVQLDLSEDFITVKKWDYPKEDSNQNASLTTDNNTTRSHLQLIAINDFAVGKDILVFAVTYESNDTSSGQSNKSYQFHVRSLDMNLQHRLMLNICPLHIRMIPYDYSTLNQQQEQFIVISQNSKILSLYDINPINDNDTIQLIDELTLDTEPEYIGFANNDLSILLIRNLFHIAIYKRMINHPHVRQRPTTLQFSLVTKQKD